MPFFGPPNVDKMKAKRDVPGLFKLVVAKGENSDQARQALIDIGPEAVLPLAREIHLSKSSPRPLAEFLDVVSAMGPAAVPALMKTADLSTPTIYLATLVIGTIGGSEAAACLERLATVSDRQHSFLIHCLATGFIKDPSGMQKRLPILLSMQSVYLHAGCVGDGFWQNMTAEIGLKMLNATHDADTTEWMAGNLGLAGDRQATAGLLALAEDRNPTRQWIGVMALGLLGDPAAIEPLKSKFKSADAAVSHAAELALAALQ